MKLKHQQAHILLVEDDPQDVASTARAFQSQGIDNSIHEARYAKMALNMLQGRDIPALYPITRFFLTGPGSATNVRAKLSNLPPQRDPMLKSCSMFVITGQSTRNDFLQASDLSVAGFIVKPIQYTSSVDIITMLNTFWNLIELPN